MNNIKNYLLDCNNTIKNGIRKINESDKKIIFIVNKSVLQGSLSDGDVRRYLISNGSIADKVSYAMNKNPISASSIHEAKKMISNSIHIVPIVDDKKRVIDIYYKEIVNKNNKISVPIVINAGGKGTRLEPFTNILPKPLIPVGDLPIIEHIMLRYKEFGCKKFYIIVNYKKQLIKAYFKENERKYNITWIDENEYLGTGGGLSLLKDRINGNFFFINCDNILLSDYSDILNKHVNNKNDITVVCANKTIVIPYGVVKVDKKMNLTKFEEKPKYTNLTNTGIYLMHSNLLKYFIKNEKIDFPTFIQRVMMKGKKVGVYEVNEKQWLDMGELPKLQEMVENLNE